MHVIDVVCSFVCELVGGGGGEISEVVFFPLLVCVMFCVKVGHSFLQRNVHVFMNT